MSDRAPPMATHGAAHHTRRDLWAPVLTAGLAVLVFLNTLGHGFVIDDLPQIRDNAWLRSFESLPAIFSSGVWDFEGRESSYYRPLMHLIYLLIFQAFGLETAPYHAVNILFHAANSVLVLLLARRLLPRGTGEAAPPAALAAGLLFATHPIHTESVAWVAGVTDLSYGFFFLLAFWLHIRSAGRRPLSLALAVVSFFLATLCKEPAFVLPAVLLAYELLLSPDRGSWRRAGWRLLPYAVAAVLSLALRAAALGGLAPVANGPDLPFHEWLASAVVLFAKYLWALVYPFPLNFWHSFVPPASLASGRAVLGLAVAVAMVALIGFAIRRAPRAAVALVLLIAPLLPAFAFRGLNQGMENAFTERYLYVPSAGFALLIALAGAWVARVRPDARPAVVSGFLALTIAYAAATVTRNPVWATHLTLWEDAVRKAPHSAQAHLSYGFTLIGEGRAEEGREHLDRALELKPAVLDEMLARAIAYERDGFDKKAILWLNNALVLQPDSPAVRVYLGGMYERKGWTAWAIQQYRLALSSHPEIAEAHYRLGRLLRDADPREALEHLEAASRLQPGNAAYREALENAARP